MEKLKDIFRAIGEFFAERKAFFLISLALIAIVTAAVFSIVAIQKVEPSPIKFVAKGEVVFVNETTNELTIKNNTEEKKYYVSSFYDKGLKVNFFERGDAIYIYIQKNENIVSSQSLEKTLLALEKDKQSDKIPYIMLIIIIAALGGLFSFLIIGSKY